MQTVKWGIIGCGDVCEVKSGPALQQADGSELVAVMRRDAALAADFARRHDVPFSSAARRVRGHRTSRRGRGLRCHAARTLIEGLRACRSRAAGKPCYVEKPMARSASGESRAMCEAFEKADVPLYVAFYRRGQTAVSDRQRFDRSGRTLGTLTGVSYRYHVASAIEKSGGQRFALASSAPKLAGAGICSTIWVRTLLDASRLICLGRLQNVRRRRGEGRATPPISRRRQRGDELHARWALRPSAARWNFAALLSALDLLEVEIWGEARQTVRCPVLAADDLQLENRAMGHSNFRWAARPNRCSLGLVQTIVDELRGQGRALSTGRSALRTMEAMDAALSRLITAGATTRFGRARAVGREIRGMDCMDCKAARRYRVFDFGGACALFASDWKRAQAPPKSNTR